jgi:tetratricopeptide (TPR) repeat protein
MATAADKAWRDPQYAAAFAQAWLEEGQYLPALEYFNKALGNNAYHLQSKIGMSLARIGRKDRIGDAANTLKELQSSETPLSPALQARLLAARAELANFEARHDAAIELADQSLAINSDEPWALFAKAKAQAAQKDPAAPKSFESLVTKNRSAPVFYFEGASALQRAGNLESALALLDQYEEAFKNVTNATADGKTQVYLERDDRYWLARGDVLRDSGRLDDALSAYDKAVAAKNIYLARATYAKGSVYLAKKDYTKAAEQLAVITPVDGSGAIPEAYIAMGDILFAKKDWAQGCQNYAFALSKFKAQSLPRERLNEMVSDVEKKLVDAGQKPVAKAWVTEARPLIQ